MTGRPRSRLWTWIIHMTSCWTGCFDSALLCREKKIKDARTQTPARAISLPPDRKDFQTEAEYAQAYLAWDVVSRAEKTRTQTSEFNFIRNSSEIQKFAEFLTHSKESGEIPGNFHQHFFSLFTPSSKVDSAKTISENVAPDAFEG